MTRPRRAFTLVEVLVSLVTFALLTGVIACVFAVAHRYTRLYQQVSSAQREAVHCVQSMSRDMLRGHSLTVHPVGTATNATWFLSNQPPVSVPIAAEFDTTGELLWQKWVGIWCRSDGDVRRAEIPLVGSPQPYLNIDLSSAPVDVIAFTSLTRFQRLASSIARFQVRTDSRVVTIEAWSETHQAGNPPTRYQISSSFLMQ